MTVKQGFKLNELLKMNLRTVKAYLLREQFQKLWEYRSPGWAGRFLDQWCHAATFSRIEPMKDLAKMLTAHRPLILNYFRAKKQFNSGIVEGLNRKINLTISKDNVSKMPISLNPQTKEWLTDFIKVAIEAKEQLFRGDRFAVEDAKVHLLNDKPIIEIEFGKEEPL